MKIAMDHLKALRISSGTVPMLPHSPVSHGPEEGRLSCGCFLCTLFSVAAFFLWQLFGYTAGYATMASQTSRGMSCCSNCCGPLSPQYICWEAEKEKTPPNFHFEKWHKYSEVAFPMSIWSEKMWLCLQEPSKITAF